MYIYLENRLSLCVCVSLKLDLWKNHLGMLNRLYGAGACGAFGLTTGQCLRVEIHGFNGLVENNYAWDMFNYTCWMFNGKFTWELNKTNWKLKKHHITSGFFCRSAALLLYDPRRLEVNLHVDLHLGDLGEIRPCWKMVAKRFVGVTPPFEVAFSRDEDTSTWFYMYCNIL